MKRLLVALALLASTAHAEWAWDPPVTLGAGARFPHLESANRAGLAVSGDTVGLVWEDSRSGEPRCYLATRSPRQAAFSPEQRVSDGACYAPVMTALGGGRFLVAWEADEEIWARVMPRGKPLRLSNAGGVQVSVAAEAGRLFSAWAESAGRFHRIVVAELSRNGAALQTRGTQPIEAQEPVDEQGWPALVVATNGKLTVAWEDRRERHTVPLASVSEDGVHFSAPTRITDQKSGSVSGLGAGMGAMRPTLARSGDHTIAAWLDKRDFLSGYDVYAAVDDGNAHFAPNLKVQDSFGDNIAQWHAKVVADAQGRVVVVWDDARDGTPDVWLAEWDGGAFGDNVAIPAAAGPGAQSQPLAAFDAAGALHVVWLDEDASGQVRLRYARAVRK